MVETVLSGTGNTGLPCTNVPIFLPKFRVCPDFSSGIGTRGQKAGSGNVEDGRNGMRNADRLPWQHIRRAHFLKATGIRLCARSELLFRHSGINRHAVRSVRMLRQILLHPQDCTWLIRPRRISGRWRFTTIPDPLPRSGASQSLRRPFSLYSFSKFTMRFAALPQFHATVSGAVFGLRLLNSRAGHRTEQFRRL